MKSARLMLKDLAELLPLLYGHRSKRLGLATPDRITKLLVVPGLVALGIALLLRQRVPRFAVFGWALLAGTVLAFPVFVLVVAGVYPQKQVDPAGRPIPQC